MIFAGTPATTALAGTSLVTTLLDPMKACSSIVTPQKMVLLIPIEASRLTRVGRFRVCG
jgi:hypothetical protein